MYKNKLQELCQRRSWELPEYTTVKDGPDHMPAFMAYVKVHGEAFQTPQQCKSAKDAQNTVAKIAFNHFYVPPPPPPPRVTRTLTPAAAAAPPGVNSVFGPVTVASPLPAVSPDVSIAFNHFNVPPPQPRVTRPLTPTSAPAAAAAPGVNSVFGAVTVASPLPGVPPAASLPAVSSDVWIARVSPGAMRPVAAVTPVIPVSPAPSSLPIPPPGLLSTKNDANTKPSNGDIMPQNCEDTTENSVIYRIAIGTQDKSYKDTLHMYKNRLQQYAQKQNLDFPVYSCEAEGPPHDRRFKSRVSFDGKSYETVEFFPTLKEAEQAAAKVACQVLSADVIQEDGGLYKNLLQEFAQKNGLLCPTYETVSSGLSHKPLFVSTVDIGSDTFRGDEGKTKKQAEMNAAKVAYIALKERFSAKESSSVSSVAVTDNLALNMQPTATPKKHQDATGEEDQMHIKRAKSSPEDISVDSSSKDSNLLSSQVENSTSAGPVTEQPVRTKTVVFPRKMNLPIPEGATVIPYSDDEWVAYKIELKSSAA